MLGVMGVFLLAFSGPQGPDATVLALPLMVLFVGFINVAIGVWRFERFLCRSIPAAPHV